MNTQIFSVGAPHPNAPLITEGAISEFLRAENTLIVMLPNITDIESNAFKKGQLKCGFLTYNGAILFLWQFYGQTGNPIILLDTPFNACVITDINLHSITDNKNRLLINVQVVDSATNTIKALRVVTMPPELTLLFLSKVQDQLATNNINNINEQINTLLLQQPQELFKQSKQYIMGT